MARKRWAVREDDEGGGFYFLFVGSKPRRPKQGWCRNRRECCRVGCIMVCPAVFEWLVPEEYHLPLDGGPVEIRFAEP